MAFCGLRPRLFSASPRLFAACYARSGYLRLRRGFFWLASLAEGRA